MLIYFPVFVQKNKKVMIIHYFEIHFLIIKKKLYLFILLKIKKITNTKRKFLFLI